MVQYYWDKYSTYSSTSTTYSNSHLVSSGSSSASITGYPNYTFSSSNGYQGYGSNYSPAVGDTVYGIISSTVMIEYYVKSKVGSTCTYDYWRYECDSGQTTTYSRGAFITTIIADQYAYTNDARNSDGYWYVRGSQYVPSNPPSTPTNFRIRSQDATSINLEWDSVSTATSYSVEVYLKGTTTNPVSQNYGITGTTKYISGLASGTTYDIKLYAVNSAGNSIPTWMYNITIGTPRPSNWSWSTLTSSATTYSVSGSLRANVVSATEWNNFCSRINEFRAYKNLGPYAFSSASSGPFSSTLYNQAVSAISSMATVTTSSRPYTALLNLSSALNSIT